MSFCVCVDSFDVLGVGVFFVYVLLQDIDLKIQTTLL